MSDSDYERARKKIFRAQGRLIAVITLCLSLFAWWSQNFVRAFVGGVILYAFLMLSLTTSRYFEGRAWAKKRKEMDESKQA